jgi:hypothetical protein
LLNERLEEHAGSAEAKPRVVEQQHPQLASDTGTEEPGTEEGAATGPEPLTEDLLDTEDLQGEGNLPDGLQGAGPAKTKRKKVLSEEKLKRIKEDHEKRGVVYVSR